MGRYLIPILKKILSALAPDKEYEIAMEPIETLSRINHDSPYSKEHPIRKIYGIETITIQAGYCGHCCVAMLAGVPLSDVIVLMGKGHASWSKILEALDYYGISYASRAVYPKGGSYQLPTCCIVTIIQTILKPIHLIPLTVKPILQSLKQMGENTRYIKLTEQR